MNSVAAGSGLHLYLPNYQTTARRTSSRGATRNTRAAWGPPPLVGVALVLLEEEADLLRLLPEGEACGYCGDDRADAEDRGEDGGQLGAKMSGSAR